ncbi:MAG: hypothetical protein NVS3B20_27610 [Polyangiales bacterium]
MLRLVPKNERPHYTVDGRVKRAFASCEEAAEFARRLTPVAYQCPMCSHWHVGRSKPHTRVIGRKTSPNKAPGRDVARSDDS